MKINWHLFHIGLLGTILSPCLSSQAQTTVTKIAAGGQHSLFVKSDGSLWGMGFNYYGQLGDGTGNYETNVPEMIVSNGVTAVSVGGNHSFFQTGSAIWAMGDNQFGELGDGTTNNVFVPKQITGGITVDTGSYDTLFTRSSGIFTDLYSMGYNQEGELGDGNLNNTNTPQRIQHDSILSVGAVYVTAIAAGTVHTLFLNSDGSLWGMGGTVNGALGDGHGTDGIFYTNRPEEELPSGVTAIAAANAFSMFIKNDGSLWTMGNNDFGELGAPNVPGLGTNRPVMIMPNSVTAIAAGTSHSMFLKSNGSLWTMGWNNTGQLGDGTFNNASQPEQIVAGGVTAISAGDAHSLFLLSDGSLWGMGETYAGQLAGITTTNQPYPTQIVGPPVANGGFESADFLGWTRQGDFLHNHVVTNAVEAHSGFAAAEMGTVGGVSYIYQMVKTIPGTNYLLSFWLKTDGGTPSEFIARWGGTFLIDEPNFIGGPWINLRYPVTANATNMLVEFGFRDDPGFITIDDISVIPMIQPTLTSATAAGSNLILNATKGQWNGAYVILMGTNLMQLPISWTAVSTNVLDGSGNFTLTATNVVNPNAPQQFFRLLLQ
jgi:alpha-tubulin suppressor-like RCC1 family protein